MTDTNLEMQTETHIDDTTNLDDGGIDQNVVTDPFMWLSAWIIYFPMVVRSTMKKGEIVKCNQIFIILYLIITITVTIGECLWYSIPPYIDDWADNKLFALVYSAATFLISIAKFLSVYYFCTQFEFQTLCSVSLDGAIPDAQHTNRTTKMIKKVNIRMKIILGVLITCLLTLLCIKIGRIATNDSDWISFLRSILYYWMFDVPLFVSQLILSVYYCKGCIFILHLHDMISNNVEEPVDFGMMHDEYRKFRSKFKKGIDLLELMLMCRIGALIAWIWIDLSTLLDPSASLLSAVQTIVYLVLDTLPFIELIFAGSSATTQYHSFKKRLYEIQQLSLQLIYFIGYVVQYPFLVKVSKMLQK